MLQQRSKLYVYTYRAWKLFDSIVLKLMSFSLKLQWLVLKKLCRFECVDSNTGVLILMHLFRVFSVLLICLHSVVVHVSRCNEYDVLYSISSIYRIVNCGIVLISSSVFRKRRKRNIENRLQNTHTHTQHQTDKH